MIVMPMPWDFGLASGHTRLMPIKERLESGDVKLVLKALSASDRGLDYCVLQRKLIGAGPCQKCGNTHKTYPLQGGQGCSWRLRERARGWLASNH